jgi:hypothetical protein
MAGFLDQGLRRDDRDRKRVVEKLSSGKVDGHDAGSGEVNIFIYTDNPALAFQEAKTVLGSRDFWVDARVAYREITKVEFTVLWPTGWNDFKVV